MSTKNRGPIVIHVVIDQPESAWPGGQDAVYLLAVVGLGQGDLERSPAEQARDAGVRIVSLDLRVAASRQANSHGSKEAEAQRQMAEQLQIAGGQVALAVQICEIIKLAITSWVASLLKTSVVVGSESVDDPLLDTATRELVVGEKRTHLTHFEYGVLRTLLQERGKTVEREMLLERVWPESKRASVSPNVVDKVVQSLRRKLGSKADMVETVRGHGYRIRAG